MFTLNYLEIGFTGLFLEGFFYGLYSGIFVIYLQHHASTKDTDKKKNIVFYSICALYILSVALFVADITLLTYELLSKPVDSILHIYFIQTTLFGCCNFIAQFILIYRCWIVWGCNTRVVIIPSILAFASLVTQLVSGSSLYISSGWLVAPAWTSLVLLSALPLPMAVNLLVTGLIVFRIFKVFREVRATSDDQILGTTGGSKLRCTILALIESGMVLFSIQLVRLVVSLTHTDAALRAFNIIIPIHEVFIGITPTIILVRISMGLSFHEEKSIEEVAIESLRFASNHTNSVQETTSINIVQGQDNRNDNVGVGRSNDINIVER